MSKSKHKGTHQEGGKRHAPAFEREEFKSAGACADDYEGVDYTHPVNGNAAEPDMGTPPGGRARYGAPEGD
jgi:hypothetical protein